ncbi:MAG: CsbD family protein [Snowella sp.]|nr:CsbD family protein [Snowella sp.]
MSTESKINATAKNLEGKAQEALGNLTGDKEMQLEGKAKQVEASAMHAVDNLKDNAKNVLDNIKNAIDKA